ncbi:MAG: hypothetical protein HYY00_07240 [Chloroflexi bacterium]|nr:hypothetical protein [Chloroflexota bacterium]
MSQSFHGRTNRRRHEPLVDALPEYFTYRDDGCEVSPSCLGCPLPRCKYDDPGGFYREQRRERDREVLSFRGRTGASVVQLARRFGVSTRTIQRILATGEDASPQGTATEARHSVNGQ